MASACRRPGSTGSLRDKPRDDYVLSTKIGRYFKVTTQDKRDGIGKFFDVPSRNEVYDYTYDGVMRSVEFSLERLGIDRIDILFAHDLDIFNHGSQEALDAKIAELMNDGGYKALVGDARAGVIKAFGAGVNEWQPCQSLTERAISTSSCWPGATRCSSKRRWRPFCRWPRNARIGLMIGGPYNSGVLATGPKPGAFYNYDPAPQEVLDKVARIQAVCDRHGVRMVDAAFQFPLRHPATVSVIPGGQGLAEMGSNLQASRAEIPPALWADLKDEGLMRRDAPV
jgi:D-threo-aldose 1-dehydrogenase